MAPDKSAKPLRFVTRDMTSGENLLHAGWAKSKSGLLDVLEVDGLRISICRRDGSIERIEPLASLYAAVSRQDQHGEPSGGWYPQQRLTLEEAVRAYTSGSAAAERASRRRGNLAPGQDADLVVLAPDPFPLEPAALRETRVELTMVGGRITFEGGSF